MTRRQRVLRYTSKKLGVLKDERKTVGVSWGRRENSASTLTGEREAVFLKESQVFS